MARKSRKTKTEGDREWAEAERRVWNEFRPRLDVLQTNAEALQIVAEAPPSDSPGRRYYSNLGFFLQAFTVPMGSSDAEKALYLQFIQRLDAAGVLKPGAAQKVKEDLRRAMELQGSW
jgi:hypothetical protein